MPVACAGEPDDSGADEGCLDDVVTAAATCRAVPLPHLHLHGCDHHPLGAESLDIAFRLAPGVMPGLGDQFGPAGDLDVARPPASLAGGRPVIVPRPDGDTQDKPGGYPALHDQLGE